jgi:hypothetical protein
MSCKVSLAVANRLQNFVKISMPALASLEPALDVAFSYTF